VKHAELLEAGMEHVLARLVERRRDPLLLVLGLLLLLGEELDQVAALDFRVDRLQHIIVVAHQPFAEEGEPIARCLGELRLQRIDPLMRKIRYLDKLVDELARDKPMASILRS
jgi:uncharacterized protein DUF2200